MLHLVSQRYTNFVDIREVPSQESQDSYYITISVHIVKKIEQLESVFFAIWVNLM